ncbi:putative Protein archease [Paratrimastix pyriformis]|uniref:Archease domain-containing protein n=1 Tax=Paratrimastix pyriformis TaxID=342808 RepID=A0ABQ8UVE3_9EUKA|nr:putative Protein archease [Paratrimastix pyriformis]
MQTNVGFHAEIFVLHPNNGRGSVRGDVDDLGESSAALGTKVGLMQAPPEQGTQGGASPGYEYLDHPADIQLHAWGPSEKEVFEQLAVAMFGYITEDITTVDPTEEREVQVEGHDIYSLLYAFLDEWLFQFNGDLFLARQVEIDDLDLTHFRIRSKGRGEIFTRGKHPSGTEIKAVTYSNMRVVRGEDRLMHGYVVVDI